ncbi:MAG TPA: hypothetical protein VF551_09820 [Chthoniobacterales bacterium]
MTAALPATEEQRIVARERLRLLEIGYYIRGGTTALFASFFLLYALLFVGMTFIPDSAWTPQPSAQASPTVAADPSPPSQATRASAAPPRALFRIFGAIMFGLVALGWAAAAFIAYAGWCIRKRQRKLVIYIAAGFSCLFVPYGTFLGVMTFLTFGSAAGKLEFSEPRFAAGTESDR